MQIKGVVVFKSDTKQITDTFKNRVLVVNDGKQYNDGVAIEFTNDSVALLDNVAIGSTVTVDVNVTGKVDKKDSTKFWNKIQGWRIS